MMKLEVILPYVPEVGYRINLKNVKEEIITYSIGETLSLAMLELVLQNKEKFNISEIKYRED